MWIGSTKGAPPSPFHDEIVLARWRGCAKREMVRAWLRSRSRCVGRGDFACGRARHKIRRPCIQRGLGHELGRLRRKRDGVTLQVLAEARCPDLSGTWSRIGRVPSICGLLQVNRATPGLAFDRRCLCLGWLGRSRGPPAWRRAGVKWGWKRHAVRPPIEQSRYDRWAGVVYLLHNGRGFMLRARCRGHHRDGD